MPLGVRVMARVSGKAASLRGVLTGNREAGLALVVGVVTLEATGNDGERGLAERDREWERPLT
jgi:hypothetical protein